MGLVAFRNSVPLWGIPILSMFNSCQQSFTECLYVQRCGLGIMGDSEEREDTVSALRGPYNFVREKNKGKV